MIHKPKPSIIETNTQSHIKRELSLEQMGCLEALKQFSKEDDDRQYFVVNGLAGTGKTTVLTEYAKQQSIYLVTFTGKASSVLREKSKLHASTIHRLIYRPIVDEETERLLGFTYHPQDLAGCIIGVDECSMINTQIGEDLLRTGAKIIAFGDPGQLSPIYGDPFFNSPDFSLKEIHRQAKDSAIIRQAHSVRSSNKYENDTDEFRVVKVLTNDNLLDNDILLCYRNNTRKHINNQIRKLKGIRDYPKAGEPIVCLQNSQKYGLCNGAIYTLREDFNPFEATGTIVIDVDGDDVEVPSVAFSGPKDVNFDDVKVRLRVKKMTTAFDFGYCLTVHKSQGSEWQKVAVIDEYNRPDYVERKKWLYTAITRSAKSVVISKYYP